MPDLPFKRTCIRCLTRSMGVSNTLNLDELLDNDEELKDLFLCADCDAVETKYEMQRVEWHCYKCNCNYWSQYKECCLSRKEELAFKKEQQTHFSSIECVANSMSNMRSRFNLDPQAFGSIKPGDKSMLTMHYEKVTMPASVNPDGPSAGDFVMIRAKFSSSYNDAKAVNWNRDGDYLTKHVIHMIKQIPSGYRTFDPVTNIWMFPERNYPIIELLMKGQKEVNNGPVKFIPIREHASLDNFMLPPEAKEKTWADDLLKNGKVKVEAAEDFFNAGVNSADVIVPEDVKSRLVALVKHILPELTPSSEKDVFMRAYKLSARKFHPDLAGGNAQKMSELNMLWSQYKEVVK